MLNRLFKTRPSVEAGRRLYTAASAQARSPWFYVEAGAPDTPEGRFEIYTLQIVLLLHRLKGQGEQAGEVSQALFDAFVRSLDEALRDLGVGDLSVGKRMRKLGEAFYGRVKSYDEAFARLPEAEPLRGVLARTVYAGVVGGPVDLLARYAVDASQRLAQQPVPDLLQGHVQWPEFPHGAH